MSEISSLLDKLNLSDKDRLSFMEVYDSLSSDYKKLLTEMVEEDAGIAMNVVEIFQLKKLAAESKDTSLFHVILIKEKELITSFEK